ncbi:hypothetical protein ABZ756_06320 [Mammaliicoccus sciuri]|uniref:Uncharacterized protein n=1 Tax=Sporosarcina newyorkensis TaxID=759851 RepID=A0A1T4YES3_9BACL|nr:MULTISPECIES: hypothetical protein [Sporosarcina]MBY0222117.1 hypothetical protein [Sporosarcina aquimarina]SKB00286.1 hypothetical protein SAMN04244570_2454 [Sporosarcina newyorkensis]
MNKWGGFSFLPVVASIISFFILRGPNTDLPLVIIILGSLSLFAIIFDNGVMLILVNFLVLTDGISV